MFPKVAEVEFSEGSFLTEQQEPSRKTYSQPVALRAILGLGFFDGAKEQVGFSLSAAESADLPGCRGRFALRNFFGRIIPHN